MLKVSRSVEEEIGASMAGEVEEIKVKLAEMGQQNLQMWENLKRLQIQMQESNAQMQNQMEILMKAILAKSRPSEQPAVDTTPNIQESAGSQMGRDYGDSPSLAAG